MLLMVNDMYEDKLDNILKALTELEIHAAKNDEHRRAMKVNIDRFWAKDWRELIERIDSINKEQSRLEYRMHQLEISMSPLPERMSKLEGKNESLDKRLFSMSMSIIIIGVAALGNAGTKIMELFN